MAAIKRVLTTAEGRHFYVRDGEKECHTQYGVVKDIKATDGSKVESNTGKEFFIFSPFYADLYRRIKRGAQIIPLKDIGLIVAETGIGKDSIIVDAGAGSGALACFLAHIAKEVITYEIREDFMDMVKKNIAFLELKNITIKNKNIYEGIDEKDVDVVTLDVPEPWKAIDATADALRPGGFLVAYCPTIPQTADFVNAIHDTPRFAHLKTMEVIEREWEVSGRKVRPKSAAIGHSGMLSFCRKLQ
jgi:tRNA (adenine57-N1/adenine58-N1)-methyltransferase